MSSEIVQANALLEASYKLSEVEQRLMWLAILKAREFCDSIEQLTNKELEIHASDYMKHFNTDKSTAYRSLKSAVLSLFEAKWGYRYINKQGLLAVRYERFTQSAEYIEKSGTVKFMFSVAIIPFLVELERNFTSYDIKQVAKLQSRYAMRLYEILIRFRSTGMVKISLDDLRFRLGLLEKEYKTMGNFKLRVLDLAVNQINEYTNLKVKYIQKKRGRIIESFEFTFTEKSNKKEKLVNGDYTISDSQIAMFSSKLAELYELGQYSKEASYEHYAMRIAKELKNSVEKRAFYKPYLEKLGFKFNFVEAVEPVPTVQAVEVVPVVPAPTAPTVAVDMVERQKKADEFLKKLDNLLINKSLKA